MDALKIDRSFISSLDTSEDDSAITRAIIVMAHSLDLKVVAEGVEKPSHLQFLRDNACDEVQGYFISKPLPATEFSQFSCQSRLNPHLADTLTVFTDRAHAVHVGIPVLLHIVFQFLNPLSSGL